MDCSVSTRSLSGPLRGTLDWAARAGAQAVEPDGRLQVRPTELGQTARRQIRHLLSERSLRVSGLLFPLKGSIADLERLDDRVQAAVDVMQLAYDLGGRRIVVPFRVPENADEQERTLDVLRRLADQGDRCGCRLTLRLGAASQELQGFLSRLPSIEMVDLQFEAASCVLAGDDLGQAFELLSKSICQLRVSDVVRSANGLGRETTIGRGEVDFELLAALASQCPIETAVVSPDDVNVSPLGDGIAFVKAVFGSLV